MNLPKRIKLIGCEVLFREISYCASQCSNIVDMDFMKKGLHDIGEKKIICGSLWVNYIMWSKNDVIILSIRTIKYKGH